MTGLNVWAQEPLTQAGQAPPPAAVPNGPHGDYYPNGNVRTKTHYKDGKLHGIKQRFDEEGLLREESHYVDGIQEGAHRILNEDGTVRSQWTDVDGQRHGVYRRYFADGKLAEERQYAAGKLLDAEGKPYNGTYTVQYPDGKVELKADYKDGWVEGILKGYWPDGSLEYEYYYVNDKKDGLCKQYDEHGGRWEITYVNDMAQGTARYFDPKNRLRIAMEMKDDDPVGERTYYGKDGKVRVPGVALNAEQNKGTLFLLWMIVFLFSLTIHEAAHAWAAHRLGDDTAYKGGQVTLNPLPHIRREPLGMLILPIVFYLSKGWMVGWASAPYDPRWALEHPRRSALMALAGPLSNLLLVIISGILIRIGLSTGLFAVTDGESIQSIVGGVSSGLPALLAALCGITFFLNTVLFGFNLLPLPPLDGSGIIQLFMPKAWAERYMMLVHQPFVVIGGLILAWNIFNQLVGLLFGVFLLVLFWGTW